MTCIRLNKTDPAPLSLTTPSLQPAFTSHAALQPDLLHFPPLPLNCHIEAATLNQCVNVCVCSFFFTCSYEKHKQIRVALWLFCVALCWFVCFLHFYRISFRNKFSPGDDASGKHLGVCRYDNHATVIYACINY